MDEHFEGIRDIYSAGERFDEMLAYADRKLKRWEEEASLLFPSQARVLDIGCGKGREAFCLHDKGFRVTGIDISGTAISAARQIAEAKRLDIRFDVSDGMNLSFPGASFDVVIIWAQTFGLFDSEESKAHILKECRRVLKEGGILSLSTHDRAYLEAHYPAYMKGGVFYPFGAEGPLYQTYTIGGLTGCVEQSGFEAVECKKGMVYTEADGTVVCCACRKPGRGR